MELAVKNKIINWEEAVFLIKYDCTTETFRETIKYLQNKTLKKEKAIIFIYISEYK
jgi:hypothetical protein